MSILDFLYGKPAERAENIIREQEEMLAQSRIRHEIALLHAIRPRPRTSTLRVRTIRWKAGIHDDEIVMTHRWLISRGATTSWLYNQRGMNSCVTWPEARK